LLTFLGPTALASPPATFNLIAETGTDGDRISREQAEADRARCAAAAAQVATAIGFGRSASTLDSASAFLNGSSLILWVIQNNRSVRRGGSPIGGICAATQNGVLL
jgi:hypothetical protein